MQQPIGNVLLWFLPAFFGACTGEVSSSGAGGAATGTSGVGGSSANGGSGATVSVASGSSSSGSATGKGGVGGSGGVAAGGKSNKPAAGGVGGGGGTTSTVTPPVGTGPTYGDPYSGQYNLGPVDWEESAWHNACAPYPASVQREEGLILAGLATGHMDGGRLCDACIRITTAEGKSTVARVVTYGDTGPNDLDLSPGACTALSGTPGCEAWPRQMSWQFTQCPDTGKISYQFQTEASAWWSSLWVRNARVPLQKVEVKSTKHATWFALQRAGDGTLTDAGGFGEGAFTLRVTAVDGQQIEETFSTFPAGALVESSQQFK